MFSVLSFMFVGHLCSLLDPRLGDMNHVNAFSTWYSGVSCQDDIWIGLYELQKSVKAKGGDIQQDAGSQEWKQQWLLIVFVCPLCNYPSYISCPSRSSFLLMCLHQHFIIPPGIITIAYFPFLFYILFIYLFIFCFTYNLRPFPSAQDLGKSLNFHQSVATCQSGRNQTFYSSQEGLP